MVVRKTLSYVSPDAFGSGEIGRQTAVEDEYFKQNPEPSVRMILSHFVQHVPEYKRAAVEMCVMSQITYEAAAETISAMRGLPTDKKTVWRWAKAGLEDIKRMLINSPWVNAATNGKIPVEFLDPSIPIDLPWEDDDGEL
jgi:hypothetical protein